jgi:ribosomal protein S27AE
MIGSQIVLPGSSDINPRKHECSRCGLEKTISDGLSIGSKWVCGKCWRSKATRPQGALQSLAAESRGRK